nr:MAG TPA: hypothetical protein [Bacteriophage sp.]
MGFSLQRRRHIGGSVSGTDQSDTNSASRQSSKRSKQVASVNDETSMFGENDE